MLSLSRAVSFLGASVLVAAAEFNASELLTSCTQGACGQNGEPDSANLLQHHHVARRMCDAYPNLQGASNFSVLAKAAITLGGTSVITGDIGGKAAITGSIVGLTIYRSGNTTLESAITGRDEAFTEVTAYYKDKAQDEDSCVTYHPELKDTIQPGFYRWDGALRIQANFKINATSTVIFHVVGAVNIDAEKMVTLAVNGDADHILWVVDGAMTVGAAAHLVGTVITKAAATFGAAAWLNGRVFAGAAITLANNNITKPV
jgi:hypothetical protein